MDWLRSIVGDHDIFVIISMTNGRRAKPKIFHHGGNDRAMVGVNTIPPASFSELELNSLKCAVSRFPPNRRHNGLIRDRFLIPVFLSTAAGRFPPC